MGRVTRLTLIAALACLSWVSGCANTTPGTAMPPAPAPTTVAPTTTVEALPALLLSAGDLAAAMGAPDLVVTSEVSRPWNDAAHFQGPDETGCLAIAGAAQQGVYADAGWSAVRGQVLREPPTAPRWAHFATQSVVLFPTADAASDFFARSRDGWPGCADRELTYTQPLGPDQVWAVGPVSADRGLLTVSRTQRSPQLWACQRALTVRARVAVDVEACSLDGAGSAAAAIAGAISARLPAA